MTPEQEALVTDNLGLVRYVTLGHSRWMLAHMEYDDLYQVGAIGLIKAAKAYDPARGKFASLAAHCIHMAQANAVRRLRTVRRRTPQILVYIEAPVGDGNIHVKDVLAAPDQDAIDLRIDVQAVLDGLPERERRIVAMRQTGLSQRKIAKEIGVSQMLVSKILSRIKSRLE